MKTAKLSTTEAYILHLITQNKKVTYQQLHQIIKEHTTLTKQYIYQIVSNLRKKKFVRITRDENNARVAILEAIE